MTSNTKWRLIAFCIFGSTLKVNRVDASQEVMKKLTLGFSKALDQCKTEVSEKTNNYLSLQIYISNSTIESVGLK